MPVSNRDRSEHFGALQRVVDQLFDEEGVSFEPKHTEKPTMAGRMDIPADTTALLGLSAFDDANLEPLAPVVTRLQVIMAAESADLPDDLLRIVNLLPSGEYTRERLATQLNSAITGHAWGQVYGTVS